MENHAIRSRLYYEENGRRDTIQIYADILTVAKTPTKTTTILRWANVQYNTFVEAVELLLKNGLLEVIPIRNNKDKRLKQQYLTTDAGKKWRRMIDEVYQVIS